MLSALLPLLGHYQHPPSPAVPQVFISPFLIIQTSSLFLSFLVSFLLSVPASKANQSINHRADGQQSPRLTVNLGSNNPFRNRTSSSPSLTAPDRISPRPLSTNPFLDDFEAAMSAGPAGAEASSPVKSPVKEKEDPTAGTTDLFVCYSTTPLLFDWRNGADVFLAGEPVAGQQAETATAATARPATTRPASGECPARRAPWPTTPSASASPSL